MADVVVYTRRGCKLCEHAEALVRRVAGPGDTVRLVDVDGDPELHARYTVRVPVVAVDGREVGELEIREDDLRAVLAGRR
jgi:glutaredoxin